MTWPADQTALHSLTVRCEAGLDQEQWALIGERLRSVADGDADPPFEPSGRAE